MSTKTQLRRQGFTLVELLVFIAIGVALAAMGTAISARIRDRAAAAKRLEDLRQAGGLLLGISSERNGRCSFFAGGTGCFEYRPYIMIQRKLGRADGDKSYVDFMHWDVNKLSPGSVPHWNCRAVNFQNVTYPDGTSTKWTQESITDGTGASGNVKSLSLSSVAHPESYPLLIDSSTSSGSEIFRINETSGEYVGLREAGGTAAAAFLFDGSARWMDRAALKKAGFTKAYDNSQPRPSSVGL